MSITSTNFRKMYTRNLNESIIRQRLLTDGYDDLMRCMEKPHLIMARRNGEWKYFLIDGSDLKECNTEGEPLC